MTIEQVTYQYNKYIVNNYITKLTELIAGTLVEKIKSNLLNTKSTTTIYQKS